MTPAQAARPLAGESGGRGVRNVNDRIKLYYGLDYGLDIHSEPGAERKYPWSFRPPEQRALFHPLSIVSLMKAVC